LEKKIPGAKNRKEKESEFILVRRSVYLLDLVFCFNGDARVESRLLINNL